jgi:NAD(P)-dependent dehydrogenase (short-subunit alcohol dehydrogenase family)
MVEKNERLAVILGGRSGLGAALANQLNQQGWQTVVIGRTNYDYDSGERCQVYHCNLADSASVARLLKIIERCHRATNASIAFFWVASAFLRGQVDDPQTSTDALQQLVNVNFTYPLPIVNSLWRRLQVSDQPTWLAAVSSASARQAESDQAAYAASLAARSHYVRCLGAENRNPHCRVGLYVPNSLATAGDQRLIAASLLDHLFQPNWGPHNVTVEVEIPTSASDPTVGRLSCE